MNESTNNEDKVMDARGKLYMAIEEFVHAADDADDDQAIRDAMRILRAVEWENADGLPDWAAAAVDGQLRRPRRR